MKRPWIWFVVSGVLEGCAGACVLMGYRAKAKRDSAEAWDQAARDIESAKAKAEAD